MLAAACQGCQKKKNDYGHALIKLCQLSSTFIYNGSVNGNIEGNFTYVDKKGKSTIDYAIVSKGLMNYIFEFNVKTPTIFSDHNPICLILENLPFVTYTNNFQNEDGIDIDKNYNPHSFYKLNDENSALFLSRLSDDFLLVQFKCYH